MIHESGVPPRPSPPWNQIRVAARLGIAYPIIQGPMGGVATQRLTAIVSNGGGLGSFGAHSLGPSALQDVISEIRSRTSKPFAINRWVSVEDAGARTSGSADARGIQNQLFDELNRPGVEILPYPLQRVAVRSLAMAAEKAGMPELLPLWAGQSASLAWQHDAAALPRALVAEVSSIAGPVLDWNRGRA